MIILSSKPKTPFLSLRIKKNQTINSRLKTYDKQQLDDFVASDEDNGPSGTVVFTISGNSNTQKNSAQLQLKNLSNITEQNSYQIIITATDEGDPPKTVSQELEIIFVATLGPKFVRNDWTVWVEENTLILSEDIILPEVHDNIGNDENIVRIYCFIDDKETAIKRLGQLQLSDPHTIDNTSLKETRISLDHCTNEKGRRLNELMERLCFILLNGSTPGDVPGNLTFGNALGKSTIDLVWSHVSCISCITALNVNHIITQSHYFPITVTLKFQMEESSTRAKSSSSQLKWNESRAEFYKSVLRWSPIVCQNFNNTSVSDPYLALENAIQVAAQDIYICSSIHRSIIVIFSEGMIMTVKT
ncbi:hypothetical protein KQX54_014238 [Cotesia glomerata]|uniref:Cadherin domain-containing protein n=1 Tax=Cotesia glomerata TaxID=32391 RepID=A0AAV7IVG6_COTGL|nr:hypothetical protein KQX54_014238 [Cotesia glomerata]